MAVLADLPAEPAGSFAAMWAILCRPELRPFERLFFECYSRGVQGEEPFVRMVPGAVDAWLAEVDAAAGGTSDPALVRLGLAVTRGLLLDLVATDDDAGVTSAAQAFVELLRRWSATLSGPRTQMAGLPRWFAFAATRRETQVKIRFGVGLGADTAPDQLGDIVDRWKPAGVDSLWFSELVYSPAVDPMVGMAYALARTTRLKVGTSVAVLPGRHPVLVAKQLASLAALAPKRVLPVFGLRSAIPAEREVFVVPDGERAAVFDESLRVLRAALLDDSASYSGRFFTVNAAAVAPRP